MYKVIKYFMDLQDKNHEYNVGDTFPRKGVKVSDERIKELAGNENKRGEPLIRDAGPLGLKGKKDDEKPADK